MPDKTKAFVISYRAHVALPARNATHAREIFEGMDEHELIEHSVVDYEDAKITREPELDETFEEF